MPQIAILAIGDELLNGDQTDTNTAEIARILSRNAFAISSSLTVGDHELAIITALQRLAADFQIVLVTGGLGPTDDDRTTRAAARAFNRPLTLNERALEQIRQRFRDWKRSMHPANEKQAMLPHRSTPLCNRLGTAPGFHLHAEETDLYFLPGVPAEMRAMLDEEVLPKICQRFPDPLPKVQRVLTVFGLPEPEIEDRILSKGLAAGVELAFAVDLPTIEVKLRASGPEAGSLVDRAELLARQALGDYVVGSGEETLAGNTARLLRLTGKTLALAESCTGGLIAKLLTDQPGASEFLDRSLVTYSNTAKTALLGIPAELIEHHGAVSAICARAMATEVRQRAGTDLGLAVTGIAGPDGGTEEKPVGTVFIALSSASNVRLERFNFPGNRCQIRLRTACTALDWLRRSAFEQEAESKELSV
ncbi:MAG: damage-inducible protein CinA [Desulfuromonas sp.]|nr:MAG: damage-inducible protein CinA [Desulfuromonas sp.]